MNYSLATLLVLSGLSIASCSSDPEVELPADSEKLTIYSRDDLNRPVGTVELIADGNYGDSDEIQIAGSSVIDDSGRVYIYDRDSGAQAIHIYAPDGSHIGRIGEPGTGIGRYQSVRAMQTRNDRLYLYDDRLDKIEIYSTNTRELEQTRLVYPELWDMISELDETYVDSFHVISDDTFILRFRKTSMYDYDRTMSVYYYAMGPVGMQLGNPVKVLEHPDAEYIHDRSEAGIHLNRSILTDAQRKPLLSSGSDNHFFYAWSDELVVREYAPDGAFLKGFYYPLTGDNLNRDEFLGSLNDIEHDVLVNAELPDSWPVLDNLLVDDTGRIWLSFTSEDRETNEWWVTDENGLKLGRFEWDLNKPIFEIRGGFAYTHERNEAENLWVSRYRIVMPDN